MYYLSTDVECGLGDADTLRPDWKLRLREWVVAEVGEESVAAYEAAYKMAQFPNGNPRGDGWKRTRIMLDSQHMAIQRYHFVRHAELKILRMAATQVGVPLSVLDTRY